MKSLSFGAVESIEKALIGIATFFPPIHVPEQDWEAEFPKTTIIATKSNLKLRNWNGKWQLI